MTHKTDGGSVLYGQRARIDVIDAAIVALLAKRLAVVAEVVALKREHGLAARLPDRVEAVVAHVRAEALRQDCPPDLAEALWRTMIEWTIRFEEGVLLSQPSPLDEGHSPQPALFGWLRGTVRTVAGVDLTEPAYSHPGEGAADGKPPS